MAVELNHTIVSARHSVVSATFMSEVLGLPVPGRFGPFVTVQLDNAVTLDFIDDEGDITPQHYAFLVGEPEFDSIFGRIQERGVRYWADPGRHLPNEVNHHDGGRGVYFEAPDGHLLEIITRPYGSGG